MGTAGRLDSKPRHKPQIVAVLLGVAGLLSGCLSDATATGERTGQPQGVPVDVLRAIEQVLPDAEQFTARLEAEDVVAVRPRVRGSIEAVHVADGAAVRQGQALFTIDPRSYQTEQLRSRAQLATAKAQRRLADQDLARARDLLPQRAIAQQEVDQLTAAADSALAAVQSAEAALRNADLNLEYTVVRAPVAGRVSRIDVTRGNLVDDQRVLTTLVGAQRLMAWFEVSEQTFLRLRQRRDVQAAVRMGLADEPDLPRLGRVDFIDNRLDPQTGTMRVRARFDNRDGQLVPGLFARVRIESSAPRAVVLAPERAIATDQDRRFIWVVGSDQKPERRQVVLGAQHGGMRVLTQGLKAGELVVVDGLQRVRPGVTLAPNLLPADAQGMPTPTPVKAST